MFIGYEVLSSSMLPGTCRSLFFNAMKRNCKGREDRTPCRNNIEVIVYQRGKCEVRVANGYFYRNKSISTIIDGENRDEISKIKSRIEKEISGFKLLEREHGN